MNILCDWQRNTLHIQDWRRRKEICDMDLYEAVTAVSRQMKLCISNSFCIKKPAAPDILQQLKIFGALEKSSEDCVGGL